MANTPFTSGNMTAQIEDILTKEFDKSYGQVFSLVEVTLRDGTTLGPIMLEMRPKHIDMVSELMREGHKTVVFSNDNESILVMADDIKHIKALRVTSKE